MQRILLFATICAYCFQCLAMQQPTFKLTIECLHQQQKKIAFNWAPHHNRYTVTGLKQEIYQQMNNQWINKEYYMTPDQQQLYYFDPSERQYLPISSDDQLQLQLIHHHNTLYIDNSYTRIHVTAPDGIRKSFRISTDLRAVYDVDSVKMNIASKLGWNIDWKSHTLWFDLGKHLESELYDGQHLAIVTGYVPNVYLTIKTIDSDEKNHAARNTEFGTADVKFHAEDAKFGIEHDINGELLGLKYKYWIAGGIISIAICIVVALLTCVIKYLIVGSIIVVICVLAAASICFIF